MSEQTSTGKGWRRLLTLIMNAKPPKLLLLTALLLSLLSTVAYLMVPIMTKELVNGFSADSLKSSQIVLMASAVFIQAITQSLSVYMFSYSGNKVVSSIRDSLWRKILKLRISYFDNNASGDVISRITNDTAVVRGLVAEHFSNFITGIVSLIGSLIIMFYMNWQMTLVIIGVFLISALLMVPLGRAMYTISKGMQDETASFTSILSRVVSDVRLVKASGAEAEEYNRGSIGINKLFRFGLKEARIQAIISPVISLIILLILVGIIGFGGAQIASGAMTAGELVAFILYLFQIIFPVMSISQFFTQYQKALGATESLAAIMQSEEEPEDGTSTIQSGKTIQLKNVSFTYKADQPILENLELTIESGKATAIVGPSGGGKTTLFSLLERFYLPSSGSIHYGNENIEQFTLRAWREQIGYVSQESPIIAGSIRDNITYGLERIISDEELAQAAEMAYADGFIRELPDAYDTEVGERGIKLSGGQRQRIAIARALLRNPNILMLDEATSNLDSSSEEIVQQALHNLMAGRTTIIIAHRLATVVDAHKIVFIEKGRITGTGTHEQLYETHLMYRKFADQQLRSGIIET
ncbi:ABC transporter ATP-binding protein [Paenibacillus sp. GSMTC-2017]|uniref:ABC transporter ATP-binding protein n=1 Tax=Paenibacillus sp. GSMTC-2017 TaxID=2794350 RepID=UPI0018D78682|nr:ABC transporter ATP-binding protein [Paenibacillus sp. GSMTC-2017]MBH5316226.1 ABC transporter ATP-binding protein [Paenibacillus sp. GSMTC-2017]